MIIVAGDAGHHRLRAAPATSFGPWLPQPLGCGFCTVLALYLPATASQPSGNSRSVSQRESEDLMVDSVAQTPGQHNV